MNCNNNKHSSKNILFIGIIIILIGGYLYTNHSAWLASTVPLLLLVCCSLMMLMKGCANKNRDGRNCSINHNKSENTKAGQTEKLETLKEGDHKND
jgi:choline-glycine betaine transporter